jgi:diguanylate cyclase
VDATTDVNPYTDDFVQASEYLRLALSLLTKHQIPPSPFNYRLGYDAVAGRNEPLRTVFAQLVEQSDGSSEENLWHLYRQMFIQDDAALQAMRQELRHIITDLHGQFETSGHSLSSYRSALNRFAEILDAPYTPAALAVEVDKVIEDTRVTEQVQQQLGQQLSNMADEIAYLRNELEQVRQESLTDALTGVLNRKAFDAALEQAVQGAWETKSPFCVLLADIDHFKQFNDTHGHLIGDKVLRFVASTLKRSLKGRDLVARFGGEEFAVILPRTNLAGAHTVAEQIRQGVSSGRLMNKSTNETYGRVTISLGMAQFRMNDSPNSLLARADQALYLAKDRGRNRVERLA